MDRKARDGAGWNRTGGGITLAGHTICAPTLTYKMRKNIILLDRKSCRAHPKYSNRRIMPKRPAQQNDDNVAHLLQGLFLKNEAKWFDKCF